MNIEQLQERRVQLAKEISTYRQYLDADGCWDSSEREEGWLNLNKDYNDNLAAIKTEDTKKREAVIKTIEEIEKDQQQPRTFFPSSRSPKQVEPKVPFNDGFKAWCKAQMGIGDITDYDRKACHDHGFNLAQKELQFRSSTPQQMRVYQNMMRRGLDPQNAPLDTTPAPDGGATIPLESFVERLEINMLYFGPMRQVSDIITTESGEPLVFPTTDDVGNVAVIIAENTTLGDGDPRMTYGQFSLGAYKYTSKMVLVPYELLQDAHVDLVGALTEQLGERLGRGTNTHQTVGTGTGQPTGIVTAAAAANDVEAAALGAVAWQDLINLEHAVDVAYRRADSIFMMNDAVIADVRKLADLDGRPIWSEGINAGAPDRISGYMVYPNNDIDGTLDASTTCAVFGQMKKYKIRRAGPVRFYRLQERYRDLDQDGFVTLVREDAGLLNAGTPPVASLTQPAS